MREGGNTSTTSTEPVGRGTASTPDGSSSTTDGSPALPTAGAVRMPWQPQSSSQSSPAAPAAPRAAAFHPLTGPAKPDTMPPPQQPVVTAKPPLRQQHPQHAPSPKPEQVSPRSAPRASPQPVPGRAPAQSSTGAFGLEMLLAAAGEGASRSAAGPGGRVGSAGGGRGADSFATAGDAPPRGVSSTATPSPMTAPGSAAGMASRFDPRRPGIVGTAGLLGVRQPGWSVPRGVPGAQTTDDRGTPQPAIRGVSSGSAPMHRSGSIVRPTVAPPAMDAFSGWRGLAPDAPQPLPWADLGAGVSAACAVVIRSRDGGQRIVPEAQFVEAYGAAALSKLRSAARVAAPVPQGAHFARAVAGGAHRDRVGGMSGSWDGSADRGRGGLGPMLGGLVPGSMEQAGGMTAGAVAASSAAAAAAAGAGAGRGGRAWSRRGGPARAAGRSGGRALAGAGDEGDYSDDSPAATSGASAEGSGGARGRDAPARRGRRPKRARSVDGEGADDADPPEEPEDASGGRTPTGSRASSRARTGEYITSRFRGVYGRSSAKANGVRWAAHASDGKRKVHLGYFNTEEDAAKAYDEAVRRFKGPNAITNFA
uniref:AP2/ERF domain-containing protein n=1 Tax=Cafeteria roenbergensis TaxID=33653 RepID=A0A7S0JSI6_CAFRO